MSLSCTETEARICDVLDGRLEPPLEMRVHAHLEECARCRAKAELWRGLVPKMRGLAPAPPAELAARRMEVEILRRLKGPETSGVARQRRWTVAAAIGTLAIAASALFWLGPWRSADAPAPALATLVRASGGVSVGGRALAAASALAAGTEIEVAPGAEAELAMERGSRLRLHGPAQLTLGGSPRAVALRLTDGRVEAEVAHRMADETFAVSTRDLRVEVRGTRFAVDTGAAGSSVGVVEGLVAVTFTDGHTQMVGAGEHATSIVEEVPASTDEEDALGAEESPPSAAPARSCRVAIRTCQASAGSVRRSMREGDSGHALRLVAAANRSAHESGSVCGRELAACEDELGYLEAEALRGAGRIDQAVAAYRALNRPGAPAAMRQNALYAAAELERRGGHTRAACADYESALAVAPRGALREEALVGAMECAEELGDSARAAAAGRKYLAEFPDGRAAPDARRLVAGAPRR